MSLFTLESSDRIQRGQLPFVCRPPWTTTDCLMEAGLNLDPAVLHTLFVRRL